MDRQHSFGYKASTSKLPIKHTGRESVKSSVRSDYKSFRSSSTGRSIANQSIGKDRRSRSLSVRQTPTQLIPGSVIRSKSRSVDRQKTKKKDVRPITDKKWQAQQIVKTQRYFQNIGAHDLLNNGSNLRPMTLKMFVELTNLLIRNIDTRSQELTMANYVDILPNILNMLMYPGVISASTMKTANTMHSWPHILAILSWLVDLNEMFAAPIEELYIEDPDATMEDKIERLNWNTTAKAFLLWNVNKDVSEVVNQYKNDYEQLLGVSDEKMDEVKKNLKQHKDILQAREDAVKKATEELKNLEQEIDVLNSDLEKGIKKVQQKKDYEHQLKMAYSQTEENIQKLKRDSEKVLQIHQDLKYKIDTQEKTVKEMEQIAEEINQYKNKKAMKLKTIRHKEKLLDEKDLKLSQLKKNLEGIINDHNLRLIEPSLKHPEFKECMLPDGGFMSQDIIEVLDKTIAKKELLMNNLSKEENVWNEKFITDNAYKEKVKKIYESKLIEIENLKAKKKAKKLEIESFIDYTRKEKELMLKRISDARDKCAEASNSVPCLTQKEQELKEYKEICTRWEHELPIKSKKMLKFFKDIQTVTNEQFYQASCVLQQINEANEKEMNKLKNKK